jgi:glutamate 5-kinase
MQGSGEVIPVVENDHSPRSRRWLKARKQETSVGGMVSKLSAAKIAQRAGCGVIIGSGKDASLFDQLLKGHSVGTYFVAKDIPGEVVQALDRDTGPLQGKRHGGSGRI